MHRDRQTDECNTECGSLGRASFTLVKKTRIFLPDIELIYLLAV